MRTGTSLGTLFALSTLLVLGSLVPSPAQAACRGWSVAGKWELQQSNRFATIVTLTQTGSQLRGTAHALTTRIGGGKDLRGQLDGSLKGNRLSFTVFWGPNVVGVYNGTISPTGRIEGVTYDKRNPGARASWYSTTRMKCLVS